MKVARSLYKRRGQLAYVAVLLLPLSFFVWVGSGAPAPVAEKVIDCQVQFRPQPGDFMITDFAPRLVPFGIETQSGADYLVKLESIRNKFSSLTFFINGGQPFETRVPVGVYVLKYASGKNWCGPVQLFGNTAIQKGLKVLSFEQTADGFEGHTVTLYGVPSGNFSTRTLPADQF